MRILVIGGTGLISSEVVALALARGHEVTCVTRGRSALPLPAGAKSIHADARDAAALRGALRGARLRGEQFDAVLQFVAFEPQQVRDDIVTFANLARQYLLISTAAAYRKSDRLRVLTEDVALGNPYWPYAQLKADCEDALRDGADAAGLPWTIVRPAHTYGPSKIPAFTGNSRHPWTIVDRMRRGAPIVIPGDGTSLWTCSHARDVAAGIVGLLGNDAANGEAVHVTRDDALTWLGIYQAIARAAGLGAEDFARQCVFVPSEALIAAAPSQEGSIRGDKMHPAVYSNAKLRSLVPGYAPAITFDQGMRECVAWFEADAARQSVDSEANAMFDRVAATYQVALGTARADG